MAVVAIAQREAESHFAVAIDKQSFDGQYNAASVIVTLSVGLSLYSSLEMLLLISTTFKKWGGLYFWSMSMCNFGVFAYSIGMMLGYFELCILWLGKVWLDVGWVCMIVSQSLALYSRLGLILDNYKILTGVKWMIIVDSFLFLIPVVVLDFGSTYSTASIFSEAYFYMEHIQMTGITIQELIISGLYLWKTTKLLKVISRTNSRRTIRQLFAINVIIICMDVALIFLQYKHYQLYQEAIKAFVYSVKLKLELNILSKLVDLVHGDAANRSMTLEILDQTRLSGSGSGSGQSNIQDGLRSPDHFITSFTGTEKDSTPIIKDAQASVHTPTRPFTNVSSDGGRSIPVVTNDFGWPERRTRRISDDLYADALRTLK